MQKTFNADAKIIQIHTHNLAISEVHILILLKTNPKNSKTKVYKFCKET